MSSSKQNNLRSLQTFEAVARHLSLTKAATELGVTQSAVSHQLRRLTDQIGERLMMKSGRSIVLTSAGEALARKLGAAFGDIDRSLSEVIGRNRKLVRLAICSSFAPGWLVPRLSSFHQANPEVGLQLCMYAREPVLTDAVADAFVTTFPEVPGFWSLLVRREMLVPVVSGRKPDLDQIVPRLITTDLEPARIGADWKICAAQGILPFEIPASQDWLFASHYIVALEMVRQGLGAALVPDFLVERELADGTLKVISDGGVATNEDYYLCIKESRRSEAPLDAVARWFRLQTNGQGKHAARLLDGADAVSATLAGI
ncbi:LysR family transcriptional regulator [Aminobacter anthyllidis]|uniref:LysR family transcriptional regulator n=1 Tax=Aminobacter anthyllidis TaxID=1035067 RepID=UPI002454E248|nr:LysR family transcriptional regulator [Aminobacter anthyllidis]MDH4985316.1 LysR family transcriptional regulator [Aminobacter anthyllidis]